MKSYLSIAIILLLLVSCIKEDYRPECTPMSFTEVQSSNLVGKWRWYKTDIEQWFDVGPSFFYEVTPQSEGFEYYFIISEDGLFKG